MDESKVIEAIKERRNYPLMGIHQDSETKYAKAVLNASKDFALLLLPAGLLVSLSRQAQKLRRIIFDEWFVGGIFDAGSVFEPATAIRFSLVFLTRKKTSLVYFSSYSGKLYSSMPKQDIKGSFPRELPKLSNAFKTYIDQIENIIKKEGFPSSTQFSRFFSIKADKFNQDHLDIGYYDPELVKNEEWIRSENWVTLSSVAEVFLPRSTHNPARNLYPKYFSYPLSKNIPISEKGTNIILQKGDILIASIDFRKAYLFHEELPYKDLRPSPTFFVIRPKSDLVTSYYLFLYLQSETARKYAARYKRGAVFQRLNLSALRDFPIVLPDIATQRYSRNVFERMYLKSDEGQLNLINDLLFSKQKVSEKQVQQEFVLEELETVRLNKKELISELLKDDFTEINHCLGVDAYKSTLILCGSILEAILLDWLSEIDQKNYFEEKNDPGLAKTIKKLQAHLGNAKDHAIRVKDKRNLIHPRRLLQNTERIDKELCKSVVDDLKEVLKQRGVETV